MLERLSDGRVAGVMPCAQSHFWFGAGGGGAVWRAGNSLMTLGDRISPAAGPGQAGRVAAGGF